MGRRAVRTLAVEHPHLRRRAEIRMFRPYRQEPHGVAEPFGDPFRPTSVKLLGVRNMSLVKAQKLARHAESDRKSVHTPTASRSSGRGR